MRSYGKLSAAVLLLLLLCCGRERTVVITAGPVHSGPGRCTYTWREGDGWAFIAWALDIEGGAQLLALQSGRTPDQVPLPGDEIVLPLHQDLSEALERRLDAARLVREATEALAEEDTSAVRNLLRQAMETDSTWSIPAYNLALIMLRQEGPRQVIEMLRPVAHKYDAALVQSEIAWNRGDTDAALRQLEICLMDEDPPFEVLAAAALIYTVTGHYYQASGIWREILASPEADAAIRLMAAEYAILQEQRAERR